MAGVGKKSCLALPPGPGGLRRIHAWKCPRLRRGHCYSQRLRSFSPGPGAAFLFCLCSGSAWGNPFFQPISPLVQWPPYRAGGILAYKDARTEAAFTAHSSQASQPYGNGFATLFSQPGSVPSGTLPLGNLKDGRAIAMMPLRLAFFIFSCHFAPASVRPSAGARFAATSTPGQACHVHCPARGHFELKPLRTCPVVQKKVLFISPEKPPDWLRGGFQV